MDGQNQHTDVQPLLQLKSLAGLITELNIARRNSRAYPKGHPVISASLTKVLAVYEELTSQSGVISLGVTNEALLVQGTALDKSNIVFRDFARILFERGIAVLTFNHGLTGDELQRFIVILGLKREQLQQHGGIEKIWQASKISSLSIQPVRYDVFLAGESNSEAETDDTGTLWDQFARYLTCGTNSDSKGLPDHLDPAVLAEMLNQQYEDNGLDDSLVTSAISTLLQTQSGENITGETYVQFAEFINNLTPELRAQFLDSSFNNTLHNRQSVAERILRNLSNRTILDTLNDISSQRLSVSSTVFSLLERLGRNVRAQQAVSGEIAEDDLAAKMKTILREHSSEEFVPDDYQRKLNYIIAADKIPRLALAERSELLSSTDSRAIENSISEILINVIRDGIETPEEREILLQNLSEMFGFFLETGDYEQLHRMIDQLHDETFPVEIRYRLIDEYTRPEYLDEILNGLSIWGKPRYEDIRSLVHKIGAPFVEQLLERLAEEKNMSLRRFYMDSLIELGPVTRIPITNRLYDSRWYYLRNLLIILATQNDPSVVPYIQPLLKHKDQRLRHEAMKTLLHFHDTQAERQLLDDLNNQLPELQNAALQLADRCSSSAVAAKLVSMLTSGGYSQSECDRKSTIIHALAEIGRAEALPELARFLATRSLLHSRQLQKLKTEIIQTLPKYPATVARPVLERLAGDSGELARLAADALTKLSGSQP